MANFVHDPLSSPMTRWITADETAELILRAKTLLDRACYKVANSDRRSSGVTALAKLGGITVMLYTDMAVVVKDAVAGVITFDHSSEGIKELYGSTAKNALEAIRKNMVLDDMADA